jgi:hypothetical protein
LVTVVLFVVTVALTAQTTGRTYIAYPDARPILDALQADLIPAELRTLAPAARQTMWPEWVSRRDAEIRARLAAGDEDSVITFLLFGVSFTSQPRYSFAAAPAQRAPEIVASDPIVQDRIRDLAARVAAPGSQRTPAVCAARHRAARRRCHDRRRAGKTAERVLRDALTADGGRLRHVFPEQLARAAAPSASEASRRTHRSMPRSRSMRR